MLSAKTALREHWPEYLIEGWALGSFMVAVGVCATLFFSPLSPAYSLPALVRTVLFAAAMGVTSVILIQSPWGKRSGAHMNPAVTLTFFRLGKVAAWDAVFYILAQFWGATLGILLMHIAAPDLLSHPAINYVATVPRMQGEVSALIGETIISFILMFLVLTVSNVARLAKFTGLFAGACVALFITFEAPLSGMSMNPARTFGSALLPHLWNSLWIYFLAAPIGMLLASAAHQFTRRRVGCAKLYHQNNKRCIFCEYQQSKSAASRVSISIVNKVPARG